MQEYPENTVRDARAMLPKMVRAAQLNELVTYSELCAPLTRTLTSIGWPLGYIRDAICIPRDLPWLNTIAVSSTTGLPGDAFLPEGTDHLAKPEYEAVFRQQRDLVFAYDGWDAVLGELGLEPILSTPEQIEAEGRAYIDYEARRRAQGEGEGHFQLKHFIAQNPDILGIADVSDVQMEYRFLSDDRADVVFDLAISHTIVEVKNGHRGELVKGIYQVVKYCALMAAEQGLGEFHAVAGYLVAYQIPRDIAAYASQFGIKCVELSRETVSGVVSHE